jgi:hypothetical protein
MKTLKMALAGSLIAGALALGAAPASAAVAFCGPRVPCTGGISSSTAWWIMACPAGVVTAAMAKNWRRHKELTAPEAWTCGLQYWWNEATGQYDRKPARKHRRR